MKLKRRRIKRGRIEIIPMIDTIVILLIFYMTFARFAEMNRESKIKLPTTHAGKDIEGTRGQVIVNMFSAEEMSVGGSPYKVGDLPGVMTKYRNEDRSITNWSVILRANQTMKYEDLSKFMKACAKAKVVDVTFATLDVAR